MIKREEIVSVIAGLCRIIEVNELLNPAPGIEHIVAADRVVYDAAQEMLKRLRPEKRLVRKPSFSESPDGQFRCPFCERRFITSQAMNVHKGVAHKGWRDKQ